MQVFSHNFHLSRLPPNPSGLHRREGERTHKKKRKKNQKVKKVVMRTLKSVINFTNYYSFSLSFPLCIIFSLFCITLTLSCAKTQKKLVAIARKTTEIVNKAATRTGSNQPVSGQLTIDLQGDRRRAVAGQVRSSDFHENIAWPAGHVKRWADARSSSL